MADEIGLKEAFSIGVSGMVGGGGFMIFLAYEDFELIANTARDIKEA